MKKTSPKPELKMGTVIWRAAFPWLPATEKWEGPVSYTHLRAHETEADLVCRLLLEEGRENCLLYTSDAADE